MNCSLLELKVFYFPREFTVRSDYLGFEELCAPANVEKRLIYAVYYYWSCCRKGALSTWSTSWRSPGEGLFSSSTVILQTFLVSNLFDLVSGNFARGDPESSKAVREELAF